LTLQVIILRALVIDSFAYIRFDSSD